MNQALKQHRTLRVLFVLTSMPVGGAETLLVDLVRSLDPRRFASHIICLKHLGPLGEVIAKELPTSSKFLATKFDLRVLPRLIRYLRQHHIDVVVTVGAGDKMFWGRLAAYFARTPVVISALHSTGWPDGIGRFNRWLTPCTDAFVAVAGAHGRFLVQQENLPSDKVHVIPNGVDTGRFQPDVTSGTAVRNELGIPFDAPVVGIVAALRPEKNHRLFLQVARRIRQQLPDSHFLVAGEGEEKDRLTELANTWAIHDCVHFLGTRTDIPDILSAINVLTLTSHIEANPVSILEALSSETPVVATNVGSVNESVIHGRTGQLVEPGDERGFVDQVMRLLNDPEMALQLGANGRQLVLDHFSLEAMVEGYQQLMCQQWQSKHRLSEANKMAAKPADTVPQQEPVEAY